MGNNKFIRNYSPISRINNFMRVNEVLNISTNITKCLNISTKFLAHKSRYCFVIFFVYMYLFNYNSLDDWGGVYEGAREFCWRDETTLIYFEASISKPSLLILYSCLW